ncbi:uncharacterized protein isoform X2 [Choristoneura fumiferana]|uniref:uncharacterized protein isoform X2 n=1 Tax=Choristoneura fumiferana TaxID=7141 RepID=UPI003D15DF71
MVLTQMIATTMFIVVLTAVRVQFGAKALAILFSVLGLLVANFIFSIIFVVGLHKKDYNLLLHYYSFNKFSVAVFILLVLCNLGLQLIYHGAARVFSVFASSIIICSLDVLIQFYFIAVIKSMILKLKAEAKTTHTNANGEAHVVLDMPITEEQDIKYDVERSNSESGEIRMKSVFPVDDLKRLQQQDS